MPILDNGGNDAMLRMAFQMIQGAQERRARQGQQQIAGAAPGATVGQVGMSPKQFSELFGKDTPFDASRVLKTETSKDVVDRYTVNYLKQLEPMKQLDIVATSLSNQSGVAGPTTMKGLEAMRGATETQQVTQQHTAQSVAESVEEGLNAWRTAKPEVRAAYGQKQSLGTTATEVESGELRNRLAIASIGEAVDAVTNPNAPIHEFLRKNDLNLGTVLAGTAMGIQELFSNWTRAFWTNKDTTDQFALATHKARLEVATELSKGTFKGVLTPLQVLAIMKSREEGTPLPKGLEGAAQVYDHGVAAYYNAAIGEQLQKGDPTIQALRTTADYITKPGVDPRTMVSVRNTLADAAARAATLSQVGPMPSDPEGMRKWDEVYQANLRRVPKTGINIPWGRDVPAENMAGPQPALAPTSAPVGPVKPVSGVTGPVPVGNVPAAAGMLTDPTTGKPPAPQLSTEDQQAIMNYIQTLQMGNAPQTPAQ
jgi:hypothetical protein